MENQLLRNHLHGGGIIVRLINKMATLNKDQLQKIAKQAREDAFDEAGKRSGIDFRKKQFSREYELYKLLNTEGRGGIR